MKVTLHPWGEDDLPLLHALLGDPAMMEHLGGPETPEKIVERQGRYVGNPGALKIVVDGVGAGWVGFWEREWQGEQIYEMGWSVLPGFQGRGVASEATRLALEAARASDGPRSRARVPAARQRALQRGLPQGRLRVAGRGGVRVPEGLFGAQQRLGLRPQPLEAPQPQRVGDDGQLESAIAAPAISGLSRPAAASGSAATL